MMRIQRLLLFMRVVFRQLWGCGGAPCVPEKPRIHISQIRGLSPVLAPQRKARYRQIRSVSRLRHSFAVIIVPLSGSLFPQNLLVDFCILVVLMVTFSLSVGAFSVCICNPLSLLQRFPLSDSILCGTISPAAAASVPECAVPCTLRRGVRSRQTERFLQPKSAVSLAVFRKAISFCFSTSRFIRSVIAYISLYRT